MLWVFLLLASKNEVTNVDQKTKLKINVSENVTLPHVPTFALLRRNQISTPFKKKKQQINKQSP